jgi:hypothetical protein
MQNLYRLPPLPVGKPRFGQSLRVFSQNHPIGLTPTEHAVAQVRAGLTGDGTSKIPTGRNVEKHVQGIGGKVQGFAGVAATNGALDETTRVYFAELHAQLEGGAAGVKRARLVEQALVKYPQLLLGHTVTSQPPVVTATDCPISLTPHQKQVALALRGGETVQVQASCLGPNAGNTLARLLLPALPKVIPSLAAQVQVVENAKTCTKSRLFSSLLRQLPEDWFR